MVVGWKTGALTRLKTFPDLMGAYGYVNRLLNQKWVSEEEYDSMWMMLLRLEEILREAGRSDMIRHDLRGLSVLHRNVRSS
jgi:hypothetical protein